MRQLNPQWVAGVRKVVNDCPYFQLQSLRLDELDWGGSSLSINLQTKHLQPFGLVHGGVAASLVDAAAFWALYTQTPDGCGLTTVEMKLNYLAPLKTGRLLGRGRVIRLGRSLGLAESRLENQDGNLAAHGTATLMVLPNSSLWGEAELPAKHL